MLPTHTSDQAQKFACSIVPIRDYSRELVFCDNEAFLRSNSLVDTINPILRFNGNASILGNEFASALHTLGALHFRLSIIPITTVQNNGLLVGTEIGLDAVPLAAEAEDDLLIFLLIQQIGAIVAIACVSAVVLELLVPRREPKLMGGSPEIINRVLCDVDDLSRGQSISIDIQGPL